MSYEVARYRGRAVDRRTVYDLAEVDRHVQMVVHKIRGMAYTGEVALNRMLVLQLVQKAAEEMAPNGAELYAACVRRTFFEIDALLQQLGCRLG